MLHRSLLTAFVLLAAAPFAKAQTAETKPRVVVWDPVFGASNDTVPINVDRLGTVAESIEQAGFPVKRLRVDQINDEKQFSAKTTDVLVMPGEGYPLAMTPGLKRFVEGGGVLLSIEGKLPFTKPLVPDVNGRWRLLPGQSEKGPRPDVLALYGLDAVPYAIDGQTFEITGPLVRYVPEASDINLGLINSFAMPRPNAKAAGIKLLPLLRVPDALSLMRPTPLAFFEKRGTGPARGLIMANWGWLFDAGTNNGWTSGPTLAKSLVTMAADWKAGRFKFTGDDVVDVDAIRKARTKKN